MKILGYIILAVLGVLAMVLLVASRRPGDFRVERRLTIRAKSERLFALVNDFRAWADWSPWAKLDPNMKTEFSGPPSGTGASYKWVGNSKVGEGSMRIRESVPSNKVDIQLEFLKPFKASNQCTFTLLPSADGLATTVSWTMTGKNALVSKVMGLFMDMDQLIGKDFEKGLANLKASAEAS